MGIAKEIFSELRSCIDYIEGQLEEVPDCFVSVKEDIAVLERKFTEEHHERRGVENLLTLIKAHPALPIVPMVSYDVVADDAYSTWMGSWGRARVDKYLIVNDRVYFYDENDIEPVLEARFGSYALMETTEHARLLAYRSLPWTEAIIVSIDSLS